MMRFEVYLALIFVLICSGCATNRQGEWVVIEQSSEEADIREAVFRYQFQNTQTAKKKDVDVIFITLDRGAYLPTQEFMDRFSDHEPPVKLASQCFAAGKWHAIVEYYTGRGGIVFAAGPIYWVSDTKVEVTGQYNKSGMNAGGNHYVLVKRNGRWTVVESRLRWIT